MRILLLTVLLITTTVASSKVKVEISKEAIFPILGFSIASPRMNEVDPFCDFIEKELAPMGVNCILLRINYSYKYAKTPLMYNLDGLSQKEVKKLRKTCMKNKIKLVPHIELFGHQSGGKPDFTPGFLLKNYPQFDETAGMDKKDIWGFRSYCPLHPSLHQVIFSMIDELLDAFKTDVIHVGCDEVTNLKKCARCKQYCTQYQKDESDLFAEEINRLNQYVKSKGASIWIWGDRMIDVKESFKYGDEALTDWEASGNNTAAAIDKVDKDVLICDWHYKRAPKTHDLFAEKGYKVISCFYNNDEVALRQLSYLLMSIEANTSIKDNYIGIMGTTWGGTVTQFMNEYKNAKYKGSSDNQKGAYSLYRLLLELQNQNN